jgi:WD40 repeat protein
LGATGGIIFIAAFTQQFLHDVGVIIDLLLSCSADGTAAAWHVSSSGLKSVRSARAIHKGSATFCCAAVSVEGASSLVVAATMGADCSVVIWRFFVDQTDESDLTQTISMGNSFALCADFFFWKNASSMSDLFLKIDKTSVAY